MSSNDCYFNWFSAKTLFYEFIIPAKTSDYIKQRLNRVQSKEQTSINILPQSLVWKLQIWNPFSKIGISNDRNSISPDKIGIMTQFTIRVDSGVKKHRESESYYCFSELWICGVFLTFLNLREWNTKNTNATWFLGQKMSRIWILPAFFRI